MSHRAIAYAKAHAARAITAGMCLFHVRTAMGIPSGGDFDGDGDADAVDAWKRARLKVPMPTSSTRIPRGAPVFWAGGSSGHGHVAIATGYGGRVWSPGVPGNSDAWRKVHIDTITAGWGLKLLGYTRDLNGHPVPDLKGLPR